jgi:hypothetical protein
MATVTNRAVAKPANGLGPRTRIISLSKSNMTQAELDAAILYLQQGGTAGTNDPVTVAGIASDGGDTGTAPEFVSGESDVVHVAIQGTGVVTVGANFGVGTTGVTAALVCDFADNV